MDAPWVVLDTNCLVSALIFSRGRFAWLRHAWQTQRFIPLVSRDTATELLRVLSYPKFKLSAAEQQSLLADFLPYAHTITLESASSLSIPDIRDPHDAMFLVLALAAPAHGLVSGDGDIQALKSQFCIPILTLAEFELWLEQYWA